MIHLDASSVLLQWSTGGLFFLWLTSRHRLVGPGYGWLLRGVYGVLALLAFVLGWRFDWVAGRDIPAAVVAVVAVAVSWQSFRCRRGGSGATDDSVEYTAAFDPRLDLVAPAVGLVGLVVAGVNAGDPVWLSVARMLAGAAFLGAVSDSMLLGHWYLIQPGLSRSPLVELVRWTGVLWLPEVVLLLLPVGMVSVWTGTIDDGYAGMLGWFWAACVITTIGLFAVTQMEFNLATVAAVLTIAGYSINDTVVIYDRVREEMRRYKKMAIPELLNLAVNRTLSRTFLTSVTTLIALLALSILGGPIIRDFSLAMIWGVVIGTYSSVFIAVPALLFLNIGRDTFSSGDDAQAGGDAEAGEPDA